MEPASLVGANGMTPNESDLQAGWIKAQPRDNGLLLEAGGDWIVAHAAQLDGQLNDVAAADADHSGAVEIDAAGIRRLDSAGAWLLVRTRRAFEKQGHTISHFTLPPLYDELVESIGEHKSPPVEIKRQKNFEVMLERVGHATVDAGKRGYGMLGYLGRVTVDAVEAFISPRGNLRIAAIVRQVEETGINALPIVGLLLFLIGLVLAYQGADQLAKVGAERFTINLLGISVLRELGVLITAIIVAGRSGSSFTAQIGTMRVNEEVDAMQTLGLNTVDVLVLPRIIGLMITLPLLTLFADIVAMIGGGVMCYFELGITAPAFLREVQQAVSLNTFLVGMIKAPVFAFVIGLVGCFEGLQVERNAASVGKLTTRSVVESIFLVIVIDAGFSIMFSIMGI